MPGIDDLLDHLAFDKNVSVAALDTLNNFPKAYKDTLEVLAMSLLKRAGLRDLFLVRRSMALFVEGGGLEVHRPAWSPLSWLSLLVDQYFEQREDNVIVLRAYAGFYGRAGHPEDIRPLDLVRDLWAQLLAHERCVVTVKPDMTRGDYPISDVGFLFHQLHKSVLQQLQHTPVLFVFDGLDKVHDYRTMDWLISKLVFSLEKDMRYPMRILVTNWTSFRLEFRDVRATLKFVHVLNEEMTAFSDAVLQR